MRTAAAEALGKMGSSGENALLKLVCSAETDIRDRAVAALESSGATAGFARQLAAEDKRGRRAQEAIASIVCAGSRRHLTDVLPDLGETERQILGTLLTVTAAQEKVESEPRARGRA
ncbi:hypothetical protein [Nesterenkonia natronophila]|uniref:hypothetical protein n=1 Tax=Nesterenkonia natronophila TaxID=2174932 RepID=UPI001314CC12